MILQCLQMLNTGGLAFELEVPLDLLGGGHEAVPLVEYLQELQNLKGSTRSFTHADR